MNIPFFLSTTTLLLSAIAMQTGCTSTPPETSLADGIRKFSPVELTTDLSVLSAGNRRALRPLVQAARIMDTLYLRQRWSGNENLLRTLTTDTSREGRERLRFFWINMGPWSTLDDHKAFLEGVPARKPLQANFYPPDITREEFTAWLDTLSGEEEEAARGFFTAIRRQGNGRLAAVPYNIEYRAELERAAALLREAADRTDSPTLDRFLRLRADAFLSNNYFTSDVAWMELDSPLDVTIGPYEVYMDELFNYKASFEAFITVRHEEETRRLSLFSDHLQDVELALPLEDRFKNRSLGTLAPIRVVDEITIGGEARAGVQSAAFNLPNDERIVTAMGSKRVMLRNVQLAKFERILIPIAAEALDPSQRSDVSFEAFFTHILAHELMHGLGPHSVMTGGKKQSVRQAMKELGSALEEAKADISALFALDHLMAHGIVDTSLERRLYVTFLAGVFRSVRFGITEAHGRGIAMLFNRLVDDGAFVSESNSGLFSVDIPRAKQAVRALTGEIMTLQANGDYNGAQVLFERYAVIRPSMQRILGRVGHVPVDITPSFPLAESDLVSETGAELNQ